ncbi:MAG TPA: dihydrodipicolinate synthase family protein [Opitutales bacterium]|nr:dihydrodipicolinate synthase family protein [Opitutales bacterium]
MTDLRNFLQQGHVIPAQPLALDENRKLSEKHQQALTRYYVDAGAGGLAVGVHSTQFEIREPQHGLFEPVLELASTAIDEALKDNPRDFAKIAGICGRTDQALQEVATAQKYGYQAGLLSLTAMGDAEYSEILDHCRRVAEVMPLIGFYLQPAVGGRVFSYRFWREFAEIPNVIAIKIAPFHRYRTIDVVRGVIDSGRDDIALYTGNDDNIIADLLTPFAFETGAEKVRWIVGGLLGQWGVGTQKAVAMLEEIKKVRTEPTLSHEWMTRNAGLTDYNAALFDVAGDFAGCIPGIHHVLAKQGLMPGRWCLNPDEVLSPGQEEEIERVHAAYPEFTDDEFVAENLDRWLS